MVRLVILALLVALAATACGPAAPNRPEGSGGQSSAAAPSAPQKPIVIAFATEPTSMEPSFGAGTGNRDFSALTSAFLAYLTPEQRPMPFLAEELPTVEKGTWKIFPDGRMETTYRLRANAKWHDGAPINAGDFVFAYQMHLDPAMPTTKIDVDRLMSSVRAIDDRTLFIEWKEPYLWAGMIYPPNFSPLPRHLLEDMYTTNKAAFVDGPHWREGWVGSGPYRIENWEPGIGITFRAHDGFALGKPATDLIVMKFITDPNTIVANLLAGTADVAFHSSIAFTQNQALEQAGWGGTTEYWRGNPRWIEYQQRDWGNIQRAVLDIRVRKALIHAIDRSAIIEGIYAGRSQVMHFWLSLEDPAYPAVDRAVTKYEYDVSRAEALLRDAGWIKGADGLARNATGEALSMSMLNQSGEIDELEGAAIANNWKTIGVSSEVQRLSRQQQTDGEFRSKFPGAFFDRRTLGYDTMGWLSTKIASLETRWSGDNRIGYTNPVLERLWPKVLATIDTKEREAILVETLTAMSADAVVNPIHFQPRAVAYRSGLIGPQQSWVAEAALIWNIREWRWSL